MSCDYCCSTATASLPLVKAIFNKAVSEGAKCGTLDISDYYYGSDLPPGDTPSVKYFVDTYPAKLLLDLGLMPYIKKDKAGKQYIFADVKKTIPGLKQSGLVAQRRLIRQLNSCGYFETSTPMLFNHATRPISFCLVVDDFCAVYH